MKSIKLIIVFIILSIVAFSCKKNNGNQAAIDRAIIQKYLKDSSLVADSTASGLYYIISEAGDSIKPTTTSAVTVYYKGYLTSGVVFDQNPSGLPIEFSLLSVVKGWQEGIPLIGKGGKIKLLIPSALGYGTTAHGAIPANSILIFDIQLDSFR